MAIWKGKNRIQSKRAEWIFSGGVNTGSDSLHVDDSQSVDEYGWDTDEHYPALSTAKAPSAYGTTGSAVTRLLTNFSTTHLVRAVGTALQYWNGTAWTAITGTFENADWSATNFDVGGPALILTNGTDAVKMWDGSTLTDLNASAPKGRHITADNLRVFIANVDTDDTPDIIHYCAFQDATDWSGGALWTVQYYTPNGGGITAMTSFGGTIWVFKKDSFANIFHTGDSRLAYRLVPNTDNVGCVNFKTLVQVGELLCWLGESDVYVGAAGASSRIGEPVRGYLNRINQDHIDKCSAFTDGSRYYLNLVIDDADEPNIRLMYDTRKGFRIWRVAGIDEEYRYGVFFNGKPYAGNADGMTYQINAAATTGAWMIESKDFDRSELEKEYWELYNQCYFPTGSTLTLEVSVNQGATWTTIGETMTGSSSAQNDATQIPLDTVPLGYWARFRFSGTGPFRLHSSQRHFRVQPLQY